VWGTLLGCASDAPPTGYAATDGDCDENDETVHPGATEVCNMKDDNCNGQIDEGAPPVVMWPDGDGDGYYTYQLGTPKMGCGNLAGYAARGGDCDDRDAEVHPGATEICNLKDDNCDGRIDEGVRPICGVGWCARYSPSCDPADCVPGPPAQEICNSFDDDCDGRLDNGACPTGMVCSGTRCVASGGGGPGGTGGVAVSPAGGGGTTSVTTGGTVGSGGGSAGDHPSSASGCAVGSALDGRPGEVSSAASWTATTLAICFALLVLRRTKRR
jgi:hypothetical protein